MSLRYVLKNMDDASKNPSASGEPSEATESDQRPDGLKEHYDVVIVGTGLVQSILASAIARTNRSVLHCDAADHYGQLDAVWTLGYLRETLLKMKGCDESKSAAPVSEESTSRTLHSSTPHDPTLRFHSYSCQDHFPMNKGTTVVTPYGRGVVHSTSTSDGALYCKIEIDLTCWTLANGSHPRLFHFSKLDNKPCQSAKEALLVETLASQQARTILKSRALALDVTPYVIFAAGVAVNTLLTSNVADYLEWKALEGILWLDRSKGATQLQRVPCNKNDVFASKLLSPMDKRRLMKFLQLIMDYGTYVAEQELLKQQQQDEDRASGISSNEGSHTDADVVQSLNERHLNQGRSLARPQNKAVATNEITQLEESMKDQSVSFENYLVQHHKSSPGVVSLIRYAMALQVNDTDDRTLSTAIQGLSRHLLSLGRFGTTAFLVPLYGSGELSQAFCRSAAVYGATYVLRQTVSSVSEVKENDRTKLQVSLTNTDLSSDTPTIPFSCTHCVAPESFILSDKKKAHRKVLRRISILRGKPLRNQQHRHMVIVPPAAAGHLYPIYGLVVDESINVAPYVSQDPFEGCSIIHLTTTVKDEESISQAEEALQSVVSDILKQPTATTTNDKQPRICDELFHVCYSYALWDAVEERHGPANLHVIPQRVAPSVEADPVFEQAKSIFETICPGEKFMEISTSMQKAIQESTGMDADEQKQQQHGEDETSYALNRAMGMVQQRQEDDPSAEQLDADPPS